VMRAEHDAFPLRPVQPAGKRITSLIVPAAIRADASRNPCVCRA
jgi:hypothetical protein